MVSENQAVDFQRGFTDAWSSVATFIPKLVVFCVILAIGWVVARIVSKIVRVILRRVGFDRVVERGGIKDMLANSNYDASDILAKLAYYAVLLITLQTAFGIWGPNAVGNLLTGIVSWLPKAFVAIVIVVVAGAIARVVKDLITSALSGLSYVGALGTTASVFIWAIGVIAALNQIGVATTVTTPVLVTALATIGGILIVGVGGGMVRPMQRRWDSWLGRLENDLPSMRSSIETHKRQESADRPEAWYKPGVRHE